MAKRTRRSITRPITIPIMTLSGGVGRQAPSKRLPTEAEVIDNAFVTLERSIEKRNGFEVVDREDSNTSHLDIYNDSTKDLFPYWLQVSDTLRYLILIDFKASTPDRPLLYVYKLLDGYLSAVNITYDPTEEERNYFTWGHESYSARNSLRVVNVGANIVVLNRNVKAGFTSGKDGKKYDLNGNLTVTDDLYRSGIFETVSKVDPEGVAEPFNKFKVYLAGDEFIYEDKIYKLTVDRLDVPEGGWTIGSSGTNFTIGDNSEYQRDAERISVRDYIYPDTTKPHLGQAVASLSEIKFPPTEGDMDAYNGEHQKIKEKYPDKGNEEGRGKIYYSAGSFGATSPGYYRVISETERPYLQKIFTPDASSVLDELRMPHKIFQNSLGEWKISPIDWDPRLGGTEDSNPGVSVFKEEDGSPRQVNLGSMAFYRDRLFISSFDTIFSSSLGDYTNLWIEDPSNIVATDPIDVQASANKFTPIISMVPFADFLFVNTDSDVQYELLGSENQITPFTAELSPTSFYSTSRMVEPQLMGSQIYFFAKERMYLYFSSRVNNINRAVEVSAHCPNYLPKQYREPTVAAARDTIFVIDDDNPNHMYGYTNRFSGDRVTQNAFFRFTLGEDVQVIDLEEFDDFLYALVSIRGHESKDRFLLLRMPLDPLELDQPRIDNKYQLVIDSVSAEPNTVYNSDTDTTRFTLPISDPSINECILWEGWDNDDDQRLTMTIISDSSDSDITVVEVDGDYSTQGSKIHFGKTFTMTVELSPQFMRDENNNIIDGVLNMRTIHLRHSKTGDYRIEATRRERTPLVSTFSSALADERGKTLPLRQWEYDGEFVAQVFGFASETEIKIISDYPTPVNITNIEIKGKFKSIHSSALS